MNKQDNNILDDLKQRIRLQYSIGYYTKAGLVETYGLSDEQIDYILSVPYRSELTDKIEAIFYGKAQGEETTK